MRKIILTVCLLLSLGAIRAEAFRINENRASFAVGFGWRNKERISNTVHFPTPNVLIERSVLPFKNFGFISAGAQFGFHHGYHNARTPMVYKESWTSVYFIPRLALYFHEAFDEDDFPKNLDLYAGIGLGFNYLSHKLPEIFVDGDNTGFKFGYTVFAGARYYFKPHAAAFAELGYGVTFLNAGITIRY